MAKIPDFLHFWKYRFCDLDLQILVFGHSGFATNNRYINLYYHIIYFLIIFCNTYQKLFNLAENPCFSTILNYKFCDLDLQILIIEPFLFSSP